MRIHRIFVFSLCCLWYAQVPAQDTLWLTLSTCLYQAPFTSPSYHAAQENYRRGYWTYFQWQARQKPGLTISGTTPRLTRAINSVLQPNGELLFRTQSQSQSDITVGINQSIAATGTQLFLNHSLSRIDLLSEPSGTLWQTTPLLLGVQQPIFQFNRLRWQRKQAPIRYAIAEKQFAEAYADMESQITDLFFATYLAKISLENAQANVTFNNATYKLAQGRFEVGNIAENDLLQAELALLNAQTEVANATLELERAGYSLLVALGLPPKQILQVTTPDIPPSIQPDTATALAQAKQNRSDWQNFSLQAMNAEMEVRQARANNRLTADLNLAFGYNQSANTLDAAYQSPLDRQTFSFGFQAPIFQWGRGRAEVNTALAGQRSVEQTLKLNKAQFEQEVIFQVEQFKLSEAQYKLAMRADTIAQRRFNVSQNRFLIGKIDITNLQIAQNEKDNARRNYIQALRSYWRAYYRLQRLTLYDFQGGFSLLEILDYQTLKRNFRETTR